MKHCDEEGKATFEQSVPLILHWDKKKSEDFIVLCPGRERFHEFPFWCPDKCNKALSVPKLHDRTAITMAQAVVETVDEMGIAKQCQRDVF